MTGAEGVVARGAEASNWLAWAYQTSKHAQADHPQTLV